MTEHNETFTCDRCGGTFPQGWSDEEAEAELARDYPGFPKEACGVLCDDCHNAFNAWRATRPYDLTDDQILAFSHPITEEQVRFLEAHPEAVKWIEAELSRLWAEEHQRSVERMTNMYLYGNPHGPEHGTTPAGFFTSPDPARPQGED